jgi:hypothetical protein
MMYYLGRPWEVCEEPAQAIHWLKQDNAAVLFTTADYWDYLQPKCPADCQVIDRRPMFPQRGELVVIARPASVALWQRGNLRR